MLMNWVRSDLGMTCVFTSKDSSDMGRRYFTKNNDISAGERICLKMRPTDDSYQSLFSSNGTVEGVYWGMMLTSLYSFPVF